MSTPLSVWTSALELLGMCALCSPSVSSPATYWHQHVFAPDTVQFQSIADVSAGSCLQVDARHEFDSSPGAQIDADVTSVKTTTTAKSPAVQVRL